MPPSVGAARDFWRVRLLITRASSPTYILGCRAVYRNMTALMRDFSQTTALFRSNCLHFGVRHLVQMLEGAGMFLTQQQFAD